MSESTAKSAALGILGPDGSPIAPKAEGKSSIDSEISPVSALSAYLNSLSRLTNLPITRASDPLNNHPWVFVASMIRAVNFAQAPLLVWRESSSETERRRTDAVRRGVKNWTPPTMEGRTFCERHLNRESNPGRFRGAQHKKLERDYDSPYWKLLKRPNPLMTQAGLLQLTSIWLSLRGEAIWLLLNENGDSVQFGEVPDEIYPVSPDLFEPAWDRQNNRLMGWFFKGQRGIPRGSWGGAGGQRIFIDLSEVIQFKYPNPMNPIRGITPISAAAAGINLDMMTDEYNRATLANNAEPGGIFTYEGGLKPEDKASFEKQIKDRHSGPSNRGRHLVLSGAWKYVPLSLTPADMEHMESKRWNREMIFGIMRVPKSVAGITDDLNYATQVGQDKNLWDKSLIPDGKIVEDSLDGTLFQGEPDTMGVAFDYSGVEALRLGQSEQIKQAKELVGVELHMPPRLAFEIVGMDVEDYPGIDDCIINGLGSRTVEDVLTEPEPVRPDASPAPDGGGEDGGEDGAGGQTEGSTRTSGRNARSLVSSLTRERKAASVWSQFAEVQSDREAAMRRGWLQWIREERRLQLEHFDQSVKSLPSMAKEVGTVDLILLGLGEVQRRIRDRFRVLYYDALAAAYALVTSEVGGVLVFDVTDPSILGTIQTRIQTLIDGPPVTLQKLLREAILTGIAEGDTPAQLRSRLSLIFDSQTTSAKTLMVARTESAGFMNLARETMFRLQGVEVLQWITAEDEKVRKTHLFFGSVGPQPIGTNYLAIPGYPGIGRGVLEYPGDTRASASEVINCRCIKTVPV